MKATLFCVVIALACSLVTSNPPIGGITQLESLPEDLTNWVVRRLSGIGGYNGLFELQSIKNPRCQVVSGIKYSFTIVVKSVSKGKDGNYFYKTCDIDVIDAPWKTQNSERYYFPQPPKCD